MNYTCSSKLRQVDWYIAQLKIAVVGPNFIHVHCVYLFIGTPTTSLLQDKYSQELNKSEAPFFYLSNRHLAYAWLQFCCIHTGIELAREFHFLLPTHFMATNFHTKRKSLFSILFRNFILVDLLPRRMRKMAAFFQPYLGEQNARYICTVRQVFQFECYFEVQFLPRLQPSSAGNRLSKAQHLRPAEQHRVWCSFPSRAHAQFTFRRPYDLRPGFYTSRVRV